MKNTKIVATLGSECEEVKTIIDMVVAGVDVVRQDLSEADMREHMSMYEQIRGASEKTPVMADTEGAKVHIGEIEDGTEIGRGDEVVLTSEDIVGDEEKIPIKSDEVLPYLEEGDCVLFNDYAELDVKETRANEAVCEVVFGEELRSGIRITVPGRGVGVDAPTEKDREDIRRAAKEGYDFVAISDIRNADCLRRVKAIINEERAHTDVIAKIGRKQAVINFDEILEEADGVMIQRGKLSKEMPAAHLPKLQREIIEKSNEAAKPVITATHKLESMTEISTATRAEKSDVASAVIDGSDAVMIAGETAGGKYPVKTVEIMKEIVKKAETSMENEMMKTVDENARTQTDKISQSVWQAAAFGDSDFIVVHTSSGGTAREVVRHRPPKPVVAFTHRKWAKRQLKIMWGVKPLYLDYTENFDGMVKRMAQKLKDKDLAEGEDELIMTAGIPTETPGNTNTMQIREVGEILRHAD